MLFILWTGNGGEELDLLKGNVKEIYKKYLLPTVGSALAMSIYSFVDTVAVGQYAGPSGTAAIAVVNIVYIIMVMIAYLCATGGSVRYGNAVGRGKVEEGNCYFTVSVFLCMMITVIAWIVFSIWHRSIFKLFGANKDVLPYAEEYGIWIIRFFPVIVMPDFLSSFLRMDGEPKKAMYAVMIGGSLNIVLDWLLVFPCGLGVKGAAMATVIGTSLQCVIMLSHFWSNKNHYHIVRIRKPFVMLKEILSTGASASILDIGNASLAVLMNNQVGRYGGTAALGVYGVINTLAMLIQAVFAGVGQTIQPGISVNYGAGFSERTEQLRKQGVRTALIIGLCIMLIGELFPSGIVSIFMHATEEVLQVAPTFIRTYFCGFPFMGYCAVMTYYLQSTMHRKASTVLALGRSVILPVTLLVILPQLFKVMGVYAAVPLSECIAAIITADGDTRNQKRVDNKIHFFTH